MVWLAVFIVVILCVNPTMKTLQLDGYEGTRRGKVARWLFLLAFAVLLLFAAVGILSPPR